MRLHIRTRFASIRAVGGNRSAIRLFALSIVGLACGAGANQAKAQWQFFTTSVTTGATYSWDAANWSTSTSATSAPSTFGNNWIPSQFARFYGTAATSYTVTVGADESMAGLFLSATGVTLNINQATPGMSGEDLNITTVGGSLPNGGTGGTLQGFYCGSSSSDSVIINAPIVGAGGVEQHSTGALALYGDNTYSGGTETTGGQTLYYNNNNSFGTGTFYLSGTSGQALQNTSSGSVTIANNVVFQTAGSSTNLVGGSGTGGAAGTNWTGTFTLAATGTAVLNTSNATSTVDEISGVISGASNINVADVGTMILAGANTYTGTTTVSGTAKLKLGAANTIASSSSLILAGGTLNPGGFSQSMTGTTLGMTASSIIDFGAGASTLSFANSSGLTWTGTLDLVNYNAGLDALQVGTNGTGLTAAQLKDIEFNGAGLGTATINANGFVVEAGAAAPEPSSWALLAGGALTTLGGVATRRKRRA